MDGGKSRTIECQCKVDMPVKKSICFTGFLMMFPTMLAAQGGSSAAIMEVAGNNGALPLQFQGQTSPINLMTLSAGVASLYDDNIESRNNDRLSDEALSFNSRLAISRETERSMINFDYEPFYMLYHHYSSLDRLNHNANLVTTFRLGSYFVLGLHDSFSYQNGNYSTVTGQTLLAGLPSPTALNDLTIAPTTRALSNTPGFDLTFLQNSRASFTFSGSYLQRRFSDQAGLDAPLFNDTSVSGSLRYQYRMTIHTDVGLLVLYQDSKYEGGALVGSTQRSQVASALFSVDSRLSSTVTVSVNGGPQYVNTLGQFATGGSVPGKLVGSGGGSITKEVKSTALNMTVKRAVTDGGGLYTSVVDTSATFGVRRRLVGRWESSWSGGFAQSDASFLQQGSKSDTATGEVDFTRPLGSRGTQLRISYVSSHQIVKGSLQQGANFDRNQITIGFDYSLKSFPIGR